MTSDAAPPVTRPRRIRLLTDADGEPRTLVILLTISGAMIVLGIGMFGALLAADMGSPGTLAAWMVIGLLLIKLPVLGIVWWLISRRHDPAGGGGWTSTECSEILDYLEREARASVGAPDESARLAYFTREAWFVADGAAAQDTARATEVALRIQALGRGTPAPGR